MRKTIAEKRGLQSRKPRKNRRVRQRHTTKIEVRTWMVRRLKPILAMIGVTFVGTGIRLWKWGSPLLLTWMQTIARRKVHIEAAHAGGAAGRLVVKGCRRMFGWTVRFVITTRPDQVMARMCRRGWVETVRLCRRCSMGSAKTIFRKRADDVSRLNITAIRTRCGVMARRCVRFFDPAAVRLEAPRRYRAHMVMITLVLVGIIAGAVTVAAQQPRPRSATAPIAGDGDDSAISGADWFGVSTGVSTTSNVATVSAEVEARQQQRASQRDPGDRPDGAGDESDSVALAAPALPSAPQQKSDRFYHPLYIFTDTPVQDVSAYPLASPPGIAVTIPHLSPPSASAEEMVGQDARIRRIRRHVFDGGVRYILVLNEPIAKIETHHEGNVITVYPF